MTTKNTAVTLLQTWSKEITWTIQARGAWHASAQAGLESLRKKLTPDEIAAFADFFEEWLRLLNPITKESRVYPKLVAQSLGRIESLDAMEALSLFILVMDIRHPSIAAAASAARANQAKNNPPSRSI